MKTEVVQTPVLTLEGYAIPGHFADVRKMVELGSGSQRETHGASAKGELERK